MPPVSGQRPIRPSGHAIETVERRNSKHLVRRVGLTLLIMLAVALVSVSAWVSYSISAPGGSAVQQIEIKPNSSLQAIGDQLEAAKLIRSSALFAIYAKFGPARGSLKPGPYQLKGSMSMNQVIDYLAAGKIAMRSFVAKDGLTIAQLADSYASQGLGTDTEFRTAATNVALPIAITTIFGKPKNNEGFLLADTYQVAANETAQSVVTRMLNNFETRALPLFATPIPGRLQPYQALVLASIVEKEAGVYEDRAGIAQVFYNRLKIGMKLESDVTVIYLTGRREPTAADLAIDSPYNTRRNPGLPPTPIDSPSLAAIQAALKPTPSSYLFFIGGNDGKTYFAQTYAEHNINIQKYLK